MIGCGNQRFCFPLNSGDLLMMNVVHFCQAPMLVNYSARLPNDIAQTSRGSSFFYASNQNWRELRASIEGYDPVTTERGNVLCDLNGSLLDVAQTKDYVEMERRRKIGLANKGKIPWNKGKKHRAETRELIKQRTIEALRDPKVRKVMSSCHHVHSDQRKEKIGFALRRLWEKRLKHKRLQERCILTWAATISEAAKMGSIGQQELDWDSYEKIKADIISDHLQWKMEKAKVKEHAELKAKRNAEVKSARNAMIAQQRREREWKVSARESKKAIKKLGGCKELSSLSCLKRKAKTTKVFILSSSKSHKQLKSPVQDEKHENQVAAAISMDKWDLEFIKKENMRKRISFAEQIRAAKNKQLENEIGIGFCPGMSLGGIGFGPD